MRSLMTHGLMSLFSVMGQNYPFETICCAKWSQVSIFPLTCVLISPEARVARQEEDGSCR